MKLDLKIDPASVALVRRALDSLSGKQLAVATAKALNDTGFHVRRAMQKEIKKAFDAPTAYITSSPRVQMATPDKLSVGIAPTYQGGKGIDPQKILQAQEFGGSRADKRSERALRKHGFLPPGYQTAMPREPFPGSDDGKGNMRGAFMVQLLSYLQAGASASSGQGYTSNMTRRRMGAIHRGTKKAAGRRYFVAGGLTSMQIEGGSLAVMRTGSAGRTSHLPKGVWAVVGGQLKPVLMFVRNPKYKPRISMERIAKDADAQEYMERRFRFRIRQAAGV